jgi:hypothetical protein
MKKKVDLISNSNVKAQVWVETVIYTLIVLTIIGIFMSFAKPKIEEIQDKSIVEQSVDMLNEIDGIMSQIVQGGVGNQRVIELGIKKGTLKVDSINDQIIFEIDGKYAYTEPGLNGEPGTPVSIGKITAITQERNRIKRVTLISNYSSIYNITYQNKEEEKILSKAPIPYRLTISNKGKSSERTLINIDL